MTAAIGLVVASFCIGLGATLGIVAGLKLATHRWVFGPFKITINGQAARP